MLWFKLLCSSWAQSRFFSDLWFFSDLCKTVYNDETIPVWCKYIKWYKCWDSDTKLYLKWTWSQIITNVKASPLEFLIQSKLLLLEIYPLFTFCWKTSLPGSRGVERGPMVDSIRVPMAAHRTTAIWCRLPKLVHVQTVSVDTVILGQTSYVDFDFQLTWSRLKSNTNKCD